MHTWPEIRTAGWVAYMFGLDPLEVLSGTTDDMEIRGACAEAVTQRLKAMQEG